jgi:hypothetical protein
MEKSAYSKAEHPRDDDQLSIAGTPAAGALPNRLLTAF